MSNIWTPPSIQAESIFDVINGQVSKFTERYNNKIPNLSNAKRLLCFSDYSGEEKESPFSVYSFLIIAGDNLGKWNESRTRLRKELLADGRRVSYKNYRDKLSQEYISAYL